MTKEEKQKAIDALKISAPIMRVTQEQYEEYIQILNKIMDWLEQESYKVSVYDDDHIWYRGVQYISLRRFLEAKSEEKNEPGGNGDAISRKLVYAFLFGLISDDDERKKALEYVNELPPVEETVTEFADRCRECGAGYGKLLKQKQSGNFTVLEDIKAEIKEWYWQADKQAIAKDPCVVDAMISLFIRMIEKRESENKDGKFS